MVPVKFFLEKCKITAPKGELPVSVQLHDGPLQYLHIWHEVIMVDSH
jgi:hypothetical protein